MGDFGQSVHYDPDRVISPTRSRQSGDKVYSNRIPFPFRNLQWLQQSCESLMSRLDSLTYITLGDIASDFSLHLMPPKLLFQILIHLRSSGVDRIKSIMSFLQNHFFQLRICWYTKASFVPQKSFSSSVNPGTMPLSIRRLIPSLLAFPFCASLIWLIKVG